MPDRLFYISASGERVGLSGPEASAGSALGLRASEWEIELSGRKLRSSSRPAREISLDVAFYTHAEADRAADVFDADVAAGTPGTIHATGWEQRAFVTSMEPSSLGHDFVRESASVTLLDGVWRKPETHTIFPQSGDEDGTKLYSGSLYAYPYLYASEIGTRYVEIDDPAPVPWEMDVYGYAVNPVITIGGNMHMFEVEIPQGCRLHVDARPNPAVELVLADGTRIDKFDDAVVGTGEGCGSYAFERMKPGKNPVRWDDLFGIDLTVWHERGNPPYAH